MLYIIIGFIVLVFGGGFLWWFIEQIASRPGAILVARFPTYYGATELTFIGSIDQWMLIFLLIGGVIWVIVSAQRTSPEGYHR